MGDTQHQKKLLSTDVRNWTLTVEQILFIMQNHNAIESAFAGDDLEFLRQFAASNEFRALFGDISFDEVYDRYETMLEAEDEAY